MPRILPNRSSKTLPAANLEAIKGAVQTIIDNLGTPIAITDAEYDPLAKLGEVTKLVCDDVLLVAQDNPSYLEDEQPLEEVHKDKTYNEQMTEVLKLLSKPVEIALREAGVSGAEYRNAMHNYEGNVKGKVNKGSTDAQLVLDRLNRIDRRTKPKSPPSTPQTPPAAS
ncbi:MAG: hypothetical protein JNL70_01015 [Saprospiraceae bacterium]|nr:hypothetical protein [Saprospiraceae bacterium]